MWTKKTFKIHSCLWCMDLKFFNYSRSQKPTTDDYLGQVDESWYITWTSKCNHLSKATTHIEHHNFPSQITLDRASCKQPSLVRDCNWPLWKIHHIPKCSLFVTPTVCWSIFFIFIGAILTPKRNRRQCLWKILGWRKKSIMVCYGIFWSGQLFLRCQFNSFSIIFLPISHHLI